MENRFEKTSKEADCKWQEKAGLDLRRDKTKILKEDLSKAQQDERNVPKTDSAQLFKGSSKVGGSKIDASEVEWKNHKQKALKKLRKLKTIQNGDERRKKLRSVEGSLWEVVLMSGTFKDKEADQVVDAYIYCHEQHGGHPLQTAVVYGRLINKNNRTVKKAVKKSNLFAHPPLRQALARRGFYLNLGFFSAAESLTLLKNFNEFLSSKGLPTEPESVWKSVKYNYGNFYKEHKLFLYIGENLNRASDQLYVRLRELVHMYKRSKTNAGENALILEQAKKLKAKGIHRRFRHIGEELDRLSGQVNMKYRTLTTQQSPILLHSTKFFKLVADYEKQFPSKGLDDIRDKFGSFAEELNCSKAELEVYWIKEGKRNYDRSKLPRWTLEDSDLLLDKIQESGEDEENCVNFESICNDHFRAKVVDWKHLREHFTRIRRVVPYYMLDDLQSVVQVAKKHLAEILRKKEESGLGEEDVEDEDLMES